MSSICVFIDDERIPEQVTWVRLPRASWHIVRTMAEWKEILQSGSRIEAVSFDYDMGPEEPVGIKFLDALILQILDGMPRPNIYIHSMNPVGRDAMVRTIESFDRFLAESE